MPLCKTSKRTRCEVCQEAQLAVCGSDQAGKATFASTQGSQVVSSLLVLQLLKLSFDLTNPLRFKCSNEPAPQRQGILTLSTGIEQLVQPHPCLLQITQVLLAPGITAASYAAQPTTKEARACMPGVPEWQQ